MYKQRAGHGSDKMLTYILCRAILKALKNQPKLPSFLVHVSSRIHRLGGNTHGLHIPEREVAFW